MKATDPLSWELRARRVEFLDSATKPKCVSKWSSEKDSSPFLSTAVRALKVMKYSTINSSLTWRKCVSKGSSINEVRVLEERGRVKDFVTTVYI